MIFNKKKEELCGLIHGNVYNTVHNELYGRLNHGGQISMNDLTMAIQWAVTRGVEEGVRTLLENQYTDEQFEQDIGLKD